MNDYSEHSGEEPQGNDASKGIPWPVFVVMLPLLYVLSIGPVGALTKSGSNNVLAWVRGIYAPVVWLHDHTLLKKPLEAYARLWGWN